MAAADLVICRAGAMTISELSMMKKSAIIIPSPNVVDNHQYKNAKVLADANATLLVEEKFVTPESLWKSITELVDNEGQRREYEKNIAVFAKDDVNGVVYDKIVKLIDEKKKK